jgi:hypothetical protein
MEPGYRRLGQARQLFHPASWERLVPKGYLEEIDPLSPPYLRLSQSRRAVHTSILVVLFDTVRAAIGCLARHCPGRLPDGYTSSSSLALLCFDLIGLIST